MAATTPPVGKRPAPSKAMETVDTPGQHSIEEVSRFLKVDPATTLKTLLVKGVSDVIAVVLRGDHELNAVKAMKLPQVAKPLAFVTPGEVELAAGCDPGSIGPVGLKIPVIADESAAHLGDFICGANQNGKHLINVNWGRDLPEPQVADLRNVVEGDACPANTDSGCKGVLRIRRGIEVGHIFQLGTKYSESMNATCLDESGNAVFMPMGCYGIGVSRIVAAAIEQHHDDKGIVWPDTIAPFKISLLPVGRQKSQAVAEAAEKLYQTLTATGVEVLFDDRDERPGVMFADMDLIGIPHRLVVGERGLAKGKIEYKNRHEAESQELSLDQAVPALQKILSANIKN
jgi:prolyl-tRNA synthetase